jgi:hypothetical protein
MEEKVTKPKAEAKPKPRQIRVEELMEIEIVDGEGRKFCLDTGQTRGSYILREVA